MHLKLNQFLTLNFFFLLIILSSYNFASGSKSFPNYIYTGREEKKNQSYLIRANRAMSGFP